MMVVVMFVQEAMANRRQLADVYVCVQKSCAMEVDALQ